MSIVNKRLVLACLLVLALGPWRDAAAAPPAAEAKSGEFTVPPGLTVERFAVDPQLANPVAFCVDEKGRVYVAEEYRFNRGTEENRSRPFLLEDDLQLQSVADRLAMFRKWADRFEGGMAWFSKHADQVRLLEDRDGDGKADRSTVFAGEFNGPLDGLAAGVIARDGDVYLTCIPNLWLLRDQDGDGKADVRKVVHHGFGVNAAFLGHDLHGLVWGPDGRLYFSVGDRGFHVETREGSTLHGPRTGAVFRCEPDGSHLEVVARGLRNPQELAFDAYGRLFAVDNNCDMGDHSRLVYVIEGGDCGWNMAYQTLREPYLTGPWHAERLWHLPHKGQPAWIVPPVAKLGAGPSGFAAYPGTGLPDAYRDHFFYCNFTGNGGVETFAVRSKGAGFELFDLQDFFKPLMATDVDFGYDGKVYVSEFGKLEWDGSNRSGRIYTIFDPARRDAPETKQLTAIFKQGFAQRPDDALIGLLHHPDMRVRLRAQYALAGRGAKSAVLFEKALAGDHRVARLHAVWGLGQLGRRDPERVGPLVAMLADSDPLVRTQSAKALGDVRWRPASGRLVGLLKDADPEVQLNAAIALGKLGDETAVEPLVALVRENDDRDPFLRHACVMGLLGTASPDALRVKARDESAAVRMAVLLVERRRSAPAVAGFLEDTDLSIATEAARAVNDLPIDSETERLARQLGTKRFSDEDASEALIRRAINARFRLGRPEDARALIEFAADSAHRPRLREEAVAALLDWESPAPRDRVTGFWRPLPRRDLAVLREPLGQAFRRFLAQPSGPLQARVIDLAEKLGLQSDHTTLLGLIRNRSADASVRLSALRLLTGHAGPWRDPALKSGLGSEDPKLRAEARGILAKVDPERAVASIRAILEDHSAPLIERQRGLSDLAPLKTAAADTVLSAWAKRLAEGQVPPELQLDVLEAASARNTAELRERVRQIRAERSGGDALASFRPSLFGGDAERGRNLFVNHGQAQCVRCHKAGGAGGVAGPDLEHVASRHDRESLLQSLIDPDAKIAPGYGSLHLALRDGQLVSGVLKNEEKGVLTVEVAGGRAITVDASEIEERAAPKSAMPTMKTVLSARDLRDVIAFLATLN
ncbi:MAG: HEAT repeat domain-containing protein [Isosphaeraceae bacterium]|nr:HEAT repeat domain-containing protein [Isosphaeraceae bacterium]